MSEKNNNLKHKTEAKLLKQMTQKRKTMAEDIDPDNDQDQDQEEDVNEDPDTRDTSESAGKIRSIELTNFLCHHWTRLDFCPEINFIVGHNGSGKSGISRLI